MKLKCHAFVLLLVVCPLLFGCGGGPPLGQVSGKVTIGGNPVPEATVTFQPVGSGRPSSAITNESGEYSLKYTADLDGALVGEHIVDISTAKVYEPIMDESERKVIPEKFPETFNVDSELKVEVKPGSNVFNFDPEQNPPITSG